MTRSTERREYLRAGLNVYVNEDIKKDSHLAQALDISEGGIRYVKPSGFFCREDEDVYLEFCLPDDQNPIKALGRVVFNRLDEHAHSTSVVFTALSPDNVDRIRRYVIRRKRAELFDFLRKEHLGEN